jgi:hypothetical protein
MEAGSDMSSEEQIAIAKYKEYQKKYLPNVRTIEGLYAADFDPETENVFDELKNYLSELSTYTKHITRAAHLRQEHYLQYIVSAVSAVSKVEEPGHKAWREGMNAVAKDCRQKLDRWSKIFDQKFEQIISHSYSEDTVISVDLTARNCDYSFYTDRNKTAEPQEKKSKITRPPKISARGRNIMRKIYRKQLLAKNARENKILDDAMAANKPYHDRIANFEKHTFGNALCVSASDLRDRLIEMGVEDPMTCKQFMPDYGSEFIVCGEVDEMINLTWVFHQAIVQLHIQLCMRSGCTFSDEDGDTFEICHKCNDRTKDITDIYEKIKGVIILLQYILQVGGFYEIASYSLTTSMLNDPRINWNSFIAHEIMMIVINKIDDDDFINNYNKYVDAMDNIGDKIRVIARSDLSTDIKNKYIRSNMIQYKNISGYTKLLARIYPGALWVMRCTMMEKFLSADSAIYGTLLRNTSGRPYLDPPIVNYNKIKRKTGVSVSVPEKTVKYYEHLRAKYERQLKNELKEFTKV